MIKHIMFTFKSKKKVYYSVLLRNHLKKIHLSAFYNVAAGKRLRLCTAGNIITPSPTLLKPEMVEMFVFLSLLLHDSIIDCGFLTWKIMGRQKLSLKQCH